MERTQILADTETDDRYGLRRAALFQKPVVGEDRMRTGGAYFVPRPHQINARKALKAEGPSQVIETRLRAIGQPAYNVRPEKADVSQSYPRLEA